MGQCLCKTQYYLEGVYFKYSWRASNKFDIGRIIDEYLGWEKGLINYYKTINRDCKPPKPGTSVSDKEVKIEYILKDAYSNGSGQLGSRRDPANLLSPPSNSGLKDYEEDDFPPDSLHNGPFFPGPKQIVDKCTCTRLPDPLTAGAFQERILGRQIQPVDGVIREEKLVPVTFKFELDVYEKVTNCKDPSKFTETVIKTEKKSIGPIEIWYEKVEYKWNSYYRYIYDHKCP